VPPGVPPSGWDAEMSTDSWAASASPRLQLHHHPPQQREQPPQQEQQPSTLARSCSRTAAVGVSERVATLEQERAWAAEEEHHRRLFDGLNLSTVAWQHGGTVQYPPRVAATPYASNFPPPFSQGDLHVLELLESPPQRASQPAGVAHAGRGGAGGAEGAGGRAGGGGAASLPKELLPEDAVTLSLPTAGLPPPKPLHMPPMNMKPLKGVASSLAARLALFSPRRRMSSGGETDQVRV
jgi:hypothetical protein